MKLLVCDDVLGVDISPTAIDKAKKLFPDVTFKALNILEEFPKDKFDVVVLNNLLWYILHDMEKVIERIHNGLMMDGFLMISQAFIEPQEYGADIIHGFSGLVEYVSKLEEFSIVKTHYHDKNVRKKDGIVILKKKG
jgi:SAM-dependent methyltransferase